MKAIYWIIGFLIAFVGVYLWTQKKSSAESMERQMEKVRKAKADKKKLSVSEQKERNP